MRIANSRIGFEKSPSDARCKILISTTLALFFIFSISSLSPLSYQSAYVTAASGFQVLCSSLPGGDTPSDLYPAGAAAAFVVDSNNGNLVLCSGGTSKTVAAAPAGSPGFGTGIAGVTTSKNGLVLAIVAQDFGLWLCKGATLTGCKSESSFINFPSTFCNNEPSAGCFANGAALDPSLNLYFADPVSFVFVECTAASNYQSCKNLPATAQLQKEDTDCLGCDNGPAWVSLQGTTFYTTAYCNGYVNKGTVSSSKAPIIFTVKSELGGIALSANNPTKTMHVYAAVDGKNSPSFCNAKDRVGTPRIMDLTDGKSLPTPVLSKGQVFYGLDSNLQFVVDF